MRRSHFELLRPICLNCRAHGQTNFLAIAIVEDEVADDILAGILGCGSCGGEYPIIDGLPIIVPDVRRFVSDNLFYLMARRDLPPALESLIGDASGQGSGLDSIRQHVSSYAWDHWGDQDPLEEKPAAGGAEPGGVARALHAALDLADADIPDGPILDFGCGTGRSVAELAARTGRPVLGIDLSIPLARVARHALTTGEVTYGRRRVGLTYDRRVIRPSLPSPDLMDVWICDLLALPFSDETFAMAVGLNVLDCLVDPRAGLAELGRILAPSAEAVMSVPFDWTANVTPIENWLGGHSQRGAHHGSAEPILDMLLSDGPYAAGALRRHKPTRDIPWHVRLHERSCMHYQALLFAARRVARQAEDESAS